VSLNLEAPNEERLKRISEKDFHRDLLLRMKWVKEIGERRGWVSQTTQFVVGASGECDREIIERVGWLYKKMRLSRVYFSAFQPVLGTPLEDHPSTPLLREYRLYQVDFLIRMYGFSVDEIVFDSCGNLPLKIDPKMAWALKHKENFPIEINRASKKELLRVPGIGPKSATRILGRKGKFRSLDELKEVGVVTKRAAPFILIDGKMFLERRRCWWLN
jgi:predicted DNA-binding helix-hairpin-helix protein